MKYHVYKNLHKDKYSIKCAKSGLVVGHADAIWMYDCNFIVSEAGRQRVLRESRKNVHAYVEGYITDYRGFVSYKDRDIERSYNWKHKTRTMVTYDPYKYDSFMQKLQNISNLIGQPTFIPVDYAKYVSLDENGVEI